MKIPKTSDILGIINKIAPTALAEEWDNPGLQIGDPVAKVTNIMVALDPTPDVIDSAINTSCQLLVTHHPLIFKPLKSISMSTPHGALIIKAAQSGLAIISMHTNYDIASGGLNDLLAHKAGLISSVPLKITSATELTKLVAFVPTGHLESVQTALFPFTVMQGNYRDCSFTSGGIGTFTPLEGARPYAGTVGIAARVPEERLEVLIRRPDLPRALKALIAAHPYEEPAFDIYPLRNEGDKQGIGRIGRLPEPSTLLTYAEQLRSTLSSPALRYVGNPDTVITKVALCSGSGAFLLHEAARAGADVLITGDVKYHDARDAENLGLCLIDAGHFPTEIIMAKEIAEQIGLALVKGGYTDCRVTACLTETDPFQILPGKVKTI